MFQVSTSVVRRAVLTVLLGPLGTVCARTNMVRLQSFIAKQLSRDA